MNSYHTLPDITVEEEDQIKFDTNVIIKIDGKVIHDENHEFKTYLPYIMFQYPN